MAKLLTGSINLSKIDKSKLFTSQKNEKFLNVSVWINDETDNYGNIASIQQQTKKDEAKIYIGNLKEYVPKEQQNNTPEPPVPTDSDDFPF